MKTTKDNWQFWVLLVMIISGIFVQSVVYGNYQEKTRKNEETIMLLVNKVDKLTDALNETNIKLGMTIGYIEANKERKKDGSDITR